MGYWASPNKQPGSLFLKTQSTETGDNMCLQKYQIRLNSGDNDSKIAIGNFVFFFETSLGEKSSVQLIENGKIVFKSFSIEELLYSLDRPVNGDITKAYLSYKRNLFSFNSKIETIWTFKTIEIFSGDKQVLTRLCPVKQKLLKGDFDEYELCWRIFTLFNTFIL